MKRKFSIFLLLLLAILTTIGTGCGNNNQKYYVNLTVEVKDSSTNQPITGANVAGAGKTGSTDASGYVVFSNIEGNKKHSFTVKAREYNDYSFNINVEKQSLSYTAYLSKQKGTITGVVFDHNKNPLEGATISITNTVITTKSNGDGSYILNDVPVSSKPYTLDVTKENYGTRKVYNVLVTSEKPNYNVPEIILTNEPGKLKGTVIEEGGSPLANVDIFISEANETTITDSRGSYSIDLLPGEYTVILSHQQYQTVTKYLVKINSNKDTVLNAELKPKPGALAGNVIDDNNRAIDNVRVTLIGTNYFNITDTSGYFYIDGIKPGSYNVSFTHELYKDSSAIVNINKAEETRLNNFKLSPKTGTLQGYVIDQNTKTPINGAIVKSLTTLDSTTTGNQGEFALRNIRIGEHRISVTATDYSKVEFNKTVKEGINNIEEQIQLFKDPGEIYGTVIDKITKQPVEGAEVTLIEDVSVTATTNKHGVFYLDNLAEGRYSIRIEKEYYKREDITGINVIPKKAENIGTINLEPLPCTVAGTTTPGAIVVIKTLGFSTTASESGSFIFNNLNPGSYVIDISKENYELKTVAFKLEHGGQNLELGNLELTPLPGKVTGLTNADQVTILENNISVSVVNGTFTFNSLMPGTYTLKYTKEGYREQLKVIDVAPNQNVNAGTVTLEPITGTITGYITCTNGNITLVERKETQYYNNPAYFTFDNLMPGTYHLTLQKQNYQSTFYTVTVKPGQTVNLGSLNVGEKLKGDPGDKRETKTLTPADRTTITASVFLPYPQEVTLNVWAEGINNTGSHWNSFIQINGTIVLQVSSGTGGARNRKSVKKYLNLNDKIYARNSTGETGKAGSYITYTVDTGYPVINIDKLFSYGPESVRIDCEDGGLTKVEYSLTSSSTSAGTYQVISNGSIVQINNKGVWYLHIRATDEAGHVSTRVEGPYIIP